MLSNSCNYYTQHRLGWVQLHEKGGKEREKPSHHGERYLIENFFAKVKQSRAIVTRYEKTARNFLAFVQLVAGIVWLS
jgi:Transposase DDE domain